MATANYLANYGDQAGFHYVAAIYFPLGTYVKALPTNGIFVSAGTVVPAIDQADFTAGKSDGVEITTAGWVQFVITGAETDVADSVGTTQAANTVDQSAL